MGSYIPQVLEHGESVHALEGEESPEQLLSPAEEDDTIHLHQMFQMLAFQAIILTQMRADASAHFAIGTSIGQLRGISLFRQEERQGSLEALFWPV